LAGGFVWKFGTVGGGEGWACAKMALGFVLHFWLVWRALAGFGARWQGLAGFCGVRLGRARLGCRIRWTFVESGTGISALTGVLHI
jgi:hypothetical protein